MTRARIEGSTGAMPVMRCIEGGAPQDIAGIAAVLDLHPNTVRKHIARLLRLGLITEEIERTGQPGRPRRVFRVATPPVDPLVRLTLLLAELHRSGGSARAMGRAAGGRTGTGTEDASSAVAAVTEAYGLTSAIDGEDVVVEWCPFDAGDADAATVCALHLGLVEGAAAARRSTVTLQTDHGKAPCRFHVWAPKPVTTPTKETA